MIFFVDIVKHISFSSIMNVNCQKVDHLMTQNQCCRDQSKSLPIGQSMIATIGDQAITDPPTLASLDERAFVDGQIVEAIGRSRAIILAGGKIVEMVKKKLCIAKFS
jgi:hypothetical protein